MGAILRDLRLAGHEAPLVLGLADDAHYPEHSNYMGATAGRVANRIGGARFVLDGAEHRTDPNFRDRHTLHGGSRGMGKRVWDVVETVPDAVTFGIDLADGEMGFPGALRATARFAVEGSTLRIDYEATCDAPTVCNLAHHSYWNLDGTEDLRHHVLTVDADRYLPVDDDLIPTRVAPVAGTRFDFRDGRRFGGRDDDLPLLDHNLCLSDGQGPLRDVAMLHSERSGIAMTIATTEPGLQVYDGAKLATPVPGLDGRTYRARAGAALEPQGWPDAPNNPGFPSVALRPGGTYRQTTTFAFSKG
ncbi:galactose mutarotase [Jannaschia sp. Os4]|nr:aldose epimerase family protein [Jannaschia sp. Os4]MBM2574965.1 galactose mutarotase [Jannaschia sp. Os4]